MKFGKEFGAQMVQEWQDAYMDYNYLKAILKDMLNSREKNASATMALAAEGCLKRRVSFYRAFSGLTSRYKDSPRKQEEEAILVSEGGSELGNYQTMFLMPSDKGGDKEILFFKRLDEEFNKVIQLYKKEVEEVEMEAEELSRQMDILIAFRIKVEKPVVRFGGSARVVNLGSIGISTGPSFVNQTNDREHGEQHMDMIAEVEMNSKRQNEEEEIITCNGTETNTNRNADGASNIDGQDFKASSLEVLDNVKINVCPETPLSTLKGILRSSALMSLSFSHKELSKAEKLMERAFIEFHRKLRLLKSYCFLNQLAFSKIMKKYDKITSRNASKTYLEMVKSSHLGSYNEVTKLMERVETSFIKHFANGNRGKGMKILRPTTIREKHSFTFLSGFFFGCSMALIVGIIVLVHARDILNSEGRSQYMETIFPLYSLFGFIVLHMLMFSANIYFWRLYRVNYAFIFGFKQGTEPSYAGIFLLSSALAVLTLAGVLSNLDMEMDTRTQSFRAFTELVPLGLAIVLFLIIICPFNIVYRSYRFFILRCLFHCLCAPLYKVTLPDFFLADQLTSQVQAIRSLEFYICYYGWGDFKTRSHKCQESNVFKSFYFVVAFIPYWFRFLQCLRRLVEEKDGIHGLNGIKYLSTIIAVAMRTSYDLKGGVTWKIIAATTSGFATIISMYWDIVIDWVLLRRNSRNPWLRNKLILPNKTVYFVAMVLNILLRLAWLQTVLGYREAPFLHRTALVALVACLEIIRRGIWNFFRLENEHLNNVGKFRASNSIPLPFNHDDEDKDA